MISHVRTLWTSSGIRQEKTFLLTNSDDTVARSWKFFVFPCWSREVKNTETGASELYDPRVVLCNGETTWLEPLSGHWFHPAPKFPGKVDWLPPTAKAAAAGSLDQSKALMDWKHNMWHVGALTQLGESWSDARIWYRSELELAEFTRTWNTWSECLVHGAKAR